MRILVTGAAGFIGSHIALTLAQKGHRVCGLDCFDSYYDPKIKHQNAAQLAQAGIALHKLDLAEDPLAGALEGVEAVIHLAAQPGNNPQTDYMSYLRNNTIATIALLEELKQHPIKLVHISTSSVYGQLAEGDENTLPAPISPYGVTKLAAEAAVSAADRRGEVPATILRYFSVYGERERPDKLFPKLFQCLKYDQKFPLFEGSLEHKRSFSYVGDVVNGTLLALQQFDKSQSQIFNLGSDEVFTTAEAIELAQKITGKTLQLQKLPPRPGDQTATAARIDKARTQLGYVPSVSLPDGLQRVWQWAQKQL